jgi:hypothetical protein
MGGLQEIVLSQRSLLPGLSGVILPLPAKSGEPYAAKIVVYISDHLGATVEEQMTVDVADGLSNLATEEQEELVSQLYEDGVTHALQNGDSAMALRSISMLAKATFVGTFETRGRGRQLLRALQEASKLMVISSETVETVIRALADVALLRDDFNSTLVHQLFALELLFSQQLLGEGGSALSPVTGQAFLAGLGNILRKDYLDSILQTDFGEDDDLDESARFTASLSDMWETIKFNVASAVLARSVDGEPPILMASDGVSMSAQRVSASAAAKAVLAPFPGARFQLPSNIGEVSGGSSMQLMVGYSALVWSGQSSPNLTFSSGVHSLTLGRIGGGGAYAAQNLPEPVLLTFEVIRPDRRR